jgi:hypothetical protein
MRCLFCLVLVSLVLSTGCHYFDPKTYTVPERERWDTIQREWWDTVPGTTDEEKHEWLKTHRVTTHGGLI